MTRPVDVSVDGGSWFGRREPSRTGHVRSVARSDHDTRPYEERTVEELRERAKEMGTSGYSKVRKDELIRNTSRSVSRASS